MNKVANELICIENIKKELCFYGIIPHAELIPGLTLKSQIKEERICIQGRSIFRAKYELALMNQKTFCDLNEILSIIDSDLIIERFKPKIEIINHAKKKQSEMKKMFSPWEDKIFRNYSLIKISFKPACIGYFESKYPVYLHNLIKALKFLNNSGASCISFNESVNNLYKKVMGDKFSSWENL